MKKSYKLLVIFGFCLVLGLGGKEVQGYFSDSYAYSGNKIGTGDWTGPELEFLEKPEQSVIYNELRVKVRGKDSHSKIHSFYYKLFSHEEGELRSDWVKPVREADCLDGACDSLEEEAEIRVPLDKIENSKHKLCEEDEKWCLDQPLPRGEYYLMVWANDESQTKNDGGNQSEKLIFNFWKWDSDILCRLETIYARAGEKITFPDVRCYNEAELVEIKWDLDAGDGVDFENPDFTGNEPVLGEGYLLPGTYEVTVSGKNEFEEEKMAPLEVNVANPELSLGDLVINELLPNPAGDDKALRPGGEWLEIYNKLEVGVDLLGFVFYDSYDRHDLVVSQVNCEEDSTMIAPKSYKVVYRNGEKGFALNNSDGEEVRLMDGFIEHKPTLLDKVTYQGSVGEGKVWARIADGEGELQESEATKGAKND